MNELRNITVWFPELESGKLEDRRSRSFLDYCLACKPKGAFADRSHFSFESMRPWLGHLLVLDHAPERDDFRYRLYGSELADRAGFDMTGKWVSDFQSSMGALFRSQYRQAVTEKCLIVSRNMYLHSRAPCDWERVICPVTKNGREQVVVLNSLVDLTGGWIRKRTTPEEALCLKD